MSDLPIFKTTLMEENERLKSKIDELESELRSHKESFKAMESQIIELEKEKTELKSNVCLLKNAVTSLSATDEMEDEEDIASVWDKANDIVLLTPKESLAQHDKEVARKFVVYANSIPLMTGINSAMLNKVLKRFEQLQEQE